LQIIKNCCGKFYYYIIVRILSTIGSTVILDENGPYYWHVKSGNIQREPPEAPLHSKTEARRSLVKDNDSVSKIIETFYNYEYILLLLYTNVNYK